MMTSESVERGLLKNNGGASLWHCSIVRPYERKARGKASRWIMASSINQLS